MAWQQGRMVDNGSLFGVVNDLHGDELGAKRQDVELCTSGLVLGHYLGDGGPFHPPSRELEDGYAIFLRLRCCVTNECAVDNSL